MNTQEPINPTIKNPNQSTGPTSEAGKATSSRNALKHGSCSFATLILASESMDDFLALEKQWFQGYGVNPDAPDTDHEAELIRAAVRADWFFLRSERNYAEAEARISAMFPSVFDWSDYEHHALQRFLRYRTANLNILAKHRKIIEDYRKNRTTEQIKDQNIQHKSKKLAMEQEKREAQREKNKPMPTIAEQIAEMKLEAIRLGYRNLDGTLTGKK